MDFFPHFFLLKETLKVFHHKNHNRFFVLTWKKAGKTEGTVERKINDVRKNKRKEEKMMNFYGVNYLSVFSTYQGTETN
jgi:hypothetical protein